MTTPNKQKNGPLVTVLISTYNRPRYLREALASVFAQTWTNFEVIVVRDGGLPVDEAIADFRDDARLVFINRDQNRGKPHSLNEALARARGEYVCYIDDDDKFYPFHIETLLNAMLGQDRCQAVYSDLYKVNCRITPDGRRIAMAKNVRISRDFDRMLMLHFNHALHVSLMHRRDLLDKTGPYNEQLNVMIDWDMTRRLCFYTDFLHVPIVTGEFYAPVGDCDRISIQRRKNVNEYLSNVMTIRSTRPPKPWPCVRDLSVIVLQRTEPAADTVRNLWAHSYYPHKYFVPLTPSEQAQFELHIPNVVPVSVGTGASREARVDAALNLCEGDFTAIVPDGLPVHSAEISFLERPLYPLLQNPQRNIAYELVEATPENWGAIFRKDELENARRTHGHLSLPDSACAAGIEIRKTAFKDYPFQFDNFLHIARQFCREGDWEQAIKIYDHAAEHFENTLWMRTLKANALYEQGRWEHAAVLAEQLNRTHPTIARLMIEARSRKKLADYTAAVALYRRAEAILDENSIEHSQGGLDAVAETPGKAVSAAPCQQENLIWTS